MTNRLICVICPQRIDGNTCSKFDREIHTSKDIPNMCKSLFKRNNNLIIANGKRFRTLL
jgi:hypothetical protein